MYIKDSRCISPQNTYTESIDFDSTIDHIGNKYIAVEPKYSDFIPAGQLRRIGKAVRMGIGTGLPLLLQNTGVDAMIIGSANGGLEDCINFLKQIIDYDEGTLTPTNFIQSTPNAVTGYLAISTKNHCYNNTHVHRGLAFDNTLLEAFYLLKENEAKKILVGSIEEISNFNYNIDFKGGHFKTEEVSSLELLKSNSAGTVCGEGATMFIVDNEKKDAEAELLDLEQICYPTKEEIINRINVLLERNGLTPSDIDALTLGYNGDARTDHYYDDVITLFNDADVFSYKNLVGDYPSSSAFALWVSSKIINGKILKNSTIKSTKRKIKNLLIYNHFQGIEHGLILMKNVR